MYDEDATFKKGGDEDPNQEGWGGSLSGGSNQDEARGSASDVAPIVHWEVYLAGRIAATEAILPNADEKNVQAPLMFPSITSAATEVALPNPGELNTQASLTCLISTTAGRTGGQAG